MNLGLLLMNGCVRLRSYTGRARISGATIAQIFSVMGCHG